MPKRVLDYRPPASEPYTVPWFKTDLLPALVTLGIIAGVNGWLCFGTRAGDLLFCGLLGFLPAINGFLAMALLACSPLVRRISGMSAKLHVWVTVLGCIFATVLDYILMSTL